jgi:hypothetical protein
MPSLEEYAEMLENLKQNLEGVDNMTKKNTQEKAVNTKKAIEQENVRAEEVKKEEVAERKMDEQEEKKVVMIVLTEEELRKMLDNLEYRLYKGLARKLNKIAQEIKETQKK